MAKVKLNIRGLSVPDRIAKAQQIVKFLTGNADFPTPQPTLAAVTAAIGDLQTAFANAQSAKQAAITATSAMHDKDAAFDLILRKLAAYVESIAGDDESKILSAGMSLRSASTATPSSSAPSGLSASEGDHDGSIDLAYDRVAGAKSYVIEISPDPPTATSWTHATVSSKSSATLSGLTSGTRYWFRVAAVTSAGQTGWSDPATKIAP